MLQFIEQRSLTNKKTASIEQILVKKRKNFSKNDLANRSLSLVVGEGLVTEPGSSWVERRRIAQPSFQGYHCWLCQNDG